MTWADLFDRASAHDPTMTAVRDALADRTAHADRTERRARPYRETHGRGPRWSGHVEREGGVRDHGGGGLKISFAR